MKFSCVVVLAVLISFIFLNRNDSAHEGDSSRINKLSQSRETLERFPSIENSRSAGNGFYFYDELRMRLKNPPNPYPVRFLSIAHNR